MNHPLLRQAIRCLVAELSIGHKAPRPPLDNPSIPDPMAFLKSYEDDENTYVLYSDVPVFTSALSSEIRPRAYNIKDNADFIHQGKVADGEGKTYIHIFSLKPEFRGQEASLSPENVEHIETVENPSIAVSPDGEEYDWR